MLARAFEFYEYAITKGFLREYGISGASGFSGEFKIMKDGSTYPIQQLHDVTEIAEKVAGKNHHFKHVQTAFNVYDRSSLLEKFQDDGNDGDWTLGEACQA